MRRTSCDVPSLQLPWLPPDANRVQSFMPYRCRTAVRTTPVSRRDGFCGHKRGQAADFSNRDEQQWQDELGQVTNIANISDMCFAG